MSRSHLLVGRSAALALSLSAAVLCAVSAPTIQAQESFTLNAEGIQNNPSAANYLWTTAPWTGVAGEYPGFDDTDDIANVIFREFNNVDGTGDPAVNLDLNALSLAIGTLTISESGTGNTDGNFTNGTLTLGTINYSSGGREVDFETSLTVNGASGSLAISTTGNALDFLGQVNAATSLSVSGSQFVRFNRNTTASFGALTQNSTAAIVIQNYDSSNAALTNFDVSALTVSNTGKLELDRVAGSAAFNLNVAGATNITASRLRLDANDDDAVLNLNGQVTLNAAAVEIGTEDQRAVININAGIVDGGSNASLTLNAHGSTSGAGDFGTINVNNVASTRTLPTTIASGRVNLNVENGLGTGAITVQANGILNLGAAQTALNIDVAEYGAIGGNLTGVNLGTNVRIANSNVIFLQGVTFTPSTATTGGAVHLLGLTSSNASVVVGDDGLAGTTDDIYRGVAIGSFSGTNDFSGTVSEAQAGQGIFVYHNSGKRYGGNGGTATFNTTNAVTGVTFFGSGLVDFNEPDSAGTTRAISANLITRDSAATAQNVTTLRFSDTNSFQNGQTINITNGRVDLDQAAAVQTGAIVNIGSGATLALDLAPSSGTFNIQNGGAISVNGNHLGGTATYNVIGSDALLIVDADLNVNAAVAAIMQQMHVVLHDADADDIDGSGIVLGNGKRLMTPSTQSADLTGGTGVSAAAGATTVTFAASSGDTLDVNDALNLGGVDVLINDPAGVQVTNIVSNGTAATNFSRVTDTFNGTVAVNTGTVRSFDVRSGLLRFDPQSVPALSSGAITQESGGTGGATTIRDGAAVEIEYDQGTAAAGIQVNETFFIEGAHNVANSNGRTFVIDRAATAAGGNNIINVNNVVVGDGASVGVDVQDTASTEARLSFKLVGTATALQQNAAGTSHDDYSFGSITGANADGSANPLDPRVLNLGFTPPGTTPGAAGAPNSANYIFNPSIYGTVASNVTLNALNAQIDFQNGAVLNGTLNVHVRTGDFYARIRSGSEGNPANRLTGTGVINLGHATGTTVEDMAGYVDEVDVGATPNPALTPLLNSTDVRVNILNLTGAGGGNRGTLRAERGINANDAQDISGLFAFANVHIENGAVVELAVANGQSIRADLVLDAGGNAAVASLSGSQAFLGLVTDPGNNDTLTITGGNSLRAINSITARRLVVGGGGLGANSGNLILQASDSQKQTVGSTTYDLLPGPVTSASLSLTEYLEVAQGGNVDVNVPISTSIRLSGTGDLDVNAPVTITGRLDGTSSAPIVIDPTGPETGAFTIGAGGTLAPGLGTGTISFDSGPVTLASGAIYEFQAGATAGSSDRVNLLGAGSSLSITDAWTLAVSSLGGINPEGVTFVLFDLANANVNSFSQPTFIDDGAGWDFTSAVVSFDAANNDVILSGVVPIPEPGTSILLAAGAFFLARRRRTRI